MTFKKLIYLSTILVCAISCQNVSVRESDGYIDLKVEVDTKLDVVSVTKSQTSSSTFAVRIVDMNDNEVFSTTDMNALTELVKLRTGRYNVHASSGVDGGAAAFDMPFYAGSAEIDVRPYTIAKAVVNCRLSSVKVTASFANEIKDNFTYSLVVENASASLTFDATTEKREGYFSPTGSLKWTLYLENAEGEKFIIEDTYAQVTAHQHYELAFSLEEEQEGSYGAGEFRIILDDNYNETYHTPTIWINEDGPSVSGEDMHVKYIADQSSDVIYTVNSSRKFTSVSVSHSDAVLLSYGLPYSSELVAGMTIGEFSQSSGVSVSVFSEDNNTLDGFTPEARVATFDFNSLMNALPVGSYQFTLTAINESGLSVEKTVTLEVKSSMVIEKLVPWSKFIFVKMNWLSQTQPSDIRLQYKKSSDGTWENFTPGVSSQFVVDPVKKTIKAFICGLEPTTQYDVRILTDKHQYDPRTCNTDKAEQLYNFDFEAWHQPDGTTWYPYNSDATAAQRVWDSANKGTAILGTSNTVPTTASGKCVKGKAVEMQTVWVDMLGITKLAAGNIYTGKFNALVGTSGANLDWGVKFTSRPLGLKGSYRYDAVSINRIGSGYESYNGKPDLCQIQIVLQDAGKPYIVVPTTFNGVSINGPTHDGQTYCDLSNDQSVIARGIREYGNTSGGFKEILLPFTYRSITRIPTHAVVTFTSSYLGDYFTGGEGSTMWADEFSYVYDPLELPDADRDAFFNLFD